MNESTKMVVVLVIVSLLSAVSLSIVYEKTEPIIKEKKSEELRNSLKEVAPLADRFEEDNELKGIISQEKEGIKKIFDAYDENNSKIAVALVIDKMGFGGTIKILIGMSLPSRKITGIKILEHLETPGLGERITEPEFLHQFIDTSLKTQTYEINAVTKAIVPAKTVIRGGEIDAITGATISSRAVIQAVIENINEISAFITRSESWGLPVNNLIGNQSGIIENATN